MALIAWRRPSKRTERDGWRERGSGDAAQVMVCQRVCRIAPRCLMPRTVDADEGVV